MALTAEQEREIIDRYKKLIAKLREGPSDRRYEIKSAYASHQLGPPGKKPRGVVDAISGDPGPRINWRSLLLERRCVCGGGLLDQRRDVICRGCGMQINRSLFEECRERYLLEIDLQRDRGELDRRIAELGADEATCEQLRQLAAQEYEKEQETRERTSSDEGRSHAPNGQMSSVLGPPTASLWGLQRWMWWSFAAVLLGGLLSEGVLTFLGAAAVVIALWRGIKTRDWRYGVWVAGVLVLGGLITGIRGY